MTLEPPQRSLVVKTLDVEEAQTQFPGDKAMILADVMGLHGSTAAFNHKLRLQLLLEPLSYRVTCGGWWCGRRRAARRGTSRR